MVLEGKARLIKSEKSRTVVRLSQELVKDSQFPFQPGDELVARVETATRRLIIEKKGPETGSKTKPQATGASARATRKP